MAFANRIGFERGGRTLDEIDKMGVLKSAVRQGVRAVIAAVLICCTVVVPGQDNAPSAWDRVLAAAGLSRQTCHFDALDMGMFAGSEFQLPWFTMLHTDPLRIPTEARMFRQNVMTLADHPFDLLVYCASRLNAGTRRTLIGDPLAWAQKRSLEPDALFRAVQEIYAATAKALSRGQIAEYRQRIRAVPADVQTSAAYLLFVEREAYRWRQRALAGFAAHHDLQQMFDLLARTDPNADEDPSGLPANLEELMHSVDMPRLMVGAEDVTLAAQRVSESLKRRVGKEVFAFDFDTPLGRIALHGAENDTYRGDIPYLLTLDTGGDDTYYGGGATYDAAHPVSVLIDLAGNDRYLESPELAAMPIAQYKGRKQHRAKPCFGAGILGYGVLIDVSGNDLYRAVSQTMGRGHFGMGLLLDEAGNDTYDAYTLCEGSADFGVGILDDLGGQDTYRCFLAAQGYGGTMGVGLLYDGGSEGDIYEANDTVIDFPSAQTPLHNTSLSQGTGNGLRADYLDGHSYAGGIGALVDAGGDNHFSAGLFAQGAGYWHGIGLLSGGPGNDTYNGVWYVQGSAAHFAVGILDDVGGNDHYRATMNMAQGAGHDYSVGFLIDEAGDDRYEAPNLSLGSGNANGFGFFWDKSGDDTYIVAPSTTLGGASAEPGPTPSVRDRDITLGIFLDTGGRDTYPAAIPAAHDNASWTYPENRVKSVTPNLRGAGLDVEAPNTPEPK